MSVDTKARPRPPLDEPAAGRLPRLSTRQRRLAFALIVGTLVAVVTLGPAWVLIGGSFDISGHPAGPGEYGLDNWREAFGSRRLRSAVWYTATLGITRLLLGLLIAIGLAWLIARSDMPWARGVEYLMWVAFFVPSLPLALGWVLVLDADYGLLNQVIRAGLDALPFVSAPLSGPFDIYGFWGITWVHLTSSTVPFLVILLTPAMRGMSASLEDAGRICGGSRLRVLRTVTVPVLRPAILGAAVLTLIHTMKSFEIELILGPVKGIYVYSTLIYEWLTHSPPRFGTASALGSIFVVALVLLTVLYQLSIRGRDFTTVTAHTFSRRRVSLGRRGRVAAAIACYSTGFLAIILPVTFVLFGSFMRRFGFLRINDPFTLAHWRTVLQDNVFVDSVVNTLVLGTGSALVGILLYFFLGSLLVRSSIPGKSIIGTLVWMPVAVPGILLGLALLWMFLATPARTILYNSMIGLIIAMVIGHMATGTQQARAAIMQVSRDHEMAARVVGARRARTLFTITLPLTVSAVVAVGILSFGSAVRDISTVVLLSSAQTRPLAILLLEYSFGGDLERGAVVGVLLAGLTVALGIAASIISRRFEIE